MAPPPNGGDSSRSRWVRAGPAYFMREAGASLMKRASRLLGLPEDLGDLLDLSEQLLGHGRVDRALRARGAGQLGGLVEQRVQLRVLLEVRRLEVVGPEHPEVVLDELGPLLLDQDRPGAELRVGVRLVLLGDRLDRLGLDPGLGRVVDPSGQVTVGADHGARGEETRKSHQDSSIRFAMIRV
jgi:hypothetical protein